MKKITVLGGGPSGLAAAWQLVRLKQGQIALYEKGETIGGICGYHLLNGYRLDYGPHKIYSVLPGIMDEFRELGKDRLREVKRKHRIVIRRRLLDYPVKLGQLLALFSLPELVSFGVSLLETMIKQPFRHTPVSYEDYCVKVFGTKVYEVVFKPLAKKIWGDPLKLSADLAMTRIPTKSIYDIIFKLLGLKKESKDADADIVLYPHRGFYDICECMKEKIESGGGRVHLRRRPVKLIHNGRAIRSIVLDNGDEVRTDLLVSSIPVRELTALLFPEDSIQDDDLIRMRHSIVVYIIVNKSRVLDDHWIFCTDTDEDIIFSRISEQKLFSDVGLPKESTILSCDFTCDEGDPIWREDDTVIAGRCIKGLEKIGIISGKDVAGHGVARIPHFYPVYDIGYKERIDKLFEKINQIENIICTGRLGLFNYNNIDHCLDMGIFLAKEVAGGKRPPDVNRGLLSKSKSYRIID
ncbi:MAG: NAD(P)-binding protein [Candidatus Omnitrophota bacterium]